MRKVLISAILLLVSQMAYAQTAAQVAPIPVFQPLDNNGNVVPGGTICSYQAGGSVPDTTYTDYTGMTANTNPVVLDSSGRANIWLTQSTKLVFSQPGTGCPSTGAQIWSVDGIAPITNNPTFNSITVAYDFISQADVNGGNAFQTSGGQTFITGAGAAKFSTVTATTTFNSDADVSASPATTTAFQTSSGNITIYGNGAANFQTVKATTTFNSQADTAVSPSTTAAFQTADGEFIVYGNGFLQAQQVSSNQLNFVGQVGTPMPPTAGNALLIYNTTAGALQYNLGGAGWVNVGSGGGGGGSPGGATTQVQVNVSGGFGAYANFTYSGTTLSAPTYITSGATGSFTSTATGGNVGYSNNGSGTTFAGIYGNGQIAGQWLALENQSVAPTPMAGDAFLYPTSTGLFLSLNGGSYVQVSTDANASIYCAGTGTNTITCPGIPVPLAYSTGMTVTLLAAGTNTGATTININSLGAKNILSGGSPLAASTLVASSVYQLLYDGVEFNLVGTSGGLPGGPTSSVQVNGGGSAFTGVAAFEFNTSNGLLTVCSTLGGICTAGTSGIASQTFNSTATGSAVAFTDQGNNFTITGAGAGAFQSLAVTAGLTVDSGSYSFNGSGTLSSASITNAGGLTQTGAATFGSTVGISGAATLSSTLSVAGNLTVNGSYGLTSGGALTVSSCTGCPGTVYSGGTGVNISFGVISIGQAVATTSNVTFGTIATTGVINGQSFQNNGGSFTMSAGGALAIQSLALGSGSPMTINTAGTLATTGNGTFANLTATATFNVGTHGGSTAISGGGAAISNASTNVALLTYDTGGVCGMGSGEPTPGVSCSSDERLKKNIALLGPALDTILQLQPKTYDWKANDAHAVGFVAQDVQAVLPNLVREQDGLLMLSQDGIIPYLVKALQEQQDEINSLRTLLVH